MQRPRCSVFIATSVDGYIARRDGAVDWLEPFQHTGEDYGYDEFAASIDALVMGRHTYETALGFGAWPYQGKRCIVLTSRPLTSRHGEKFFSGDPARLVDRLGAEGARSLYIDGGQVIRSFLSAGLIDDLTLSTIPVLLGDGIPLWASAGRGQALTLEESRHWPSGVVRLKYRVAR